ncbi:hypothetical protein GOV10_03615 [Candidatus Woesearchaeota archaeon]|nr:hypothetical protein [Candidatus Woesearchaeota archaeon]
MKISHLMSKANLMSHSQTFPWLLDRCFICERRESNLHFFSITNDGLEALSDFERGEEGVLM